jgi:hypothetical protein
LYKAFIKPGKTKELLLKLDSGKNPGYIEGSVLIKTDIPKLHEKIIPIGASVFTK